MLFYYLLRKIIWIYAQAVTVANCHLWHSSCKDGLVCLTIIIATRQIFYDSELVALGKQKISWMRTNFSRCQVVILFIFPFWSGYNSHSPVSWNHASKHLARKGWLVYSRYRKPLITDVLLTQEHDSLQPLEWLAIRFRCFQNPSLNHSISTESLHKRHNISLQKYEKSW